MKQYNTFNEFKSALEESGKFEIQEDCLVSHDPVVDGNRYSIVFGQYEPFKNEEDIANYCQIVFHGNEDAYDAWVHAEFNEPPFVGEFGKLHEFLTGELLTL